MSSYSCVIKPAVTRAQGKSAISKAAYNNRTELRDGRTGELTKDYSYLGNILWSGIFVDPKFNAPDWIQDRAALWNAVSAAEKRKDAREAQEIELNLPCDLPMEKQLFMLKDFVREHITRGTGRIADMNVHPAPDHGDDRNTHAHILMTTRAIGPDGFSAKKLPDVTPQQIVHWKEKWAERGAKELRKAGFEIEADRWAEGWRDRDQQIEAARARGDLEHALMLESRRDENHRGPAADAMERKGQDAERSDPARDIDQLAALKLDLSKTNLEIWSIEHDARREIEWQDALAQAAIEKEQRGEPGGREKTIEETQQPELAEKVLDGTGAVLEFSIECVEMLADFLTGGTPPPTRQQILGEILADIDELKRQGQRSISRQDDLIGKMLEAGERLTELGMQGFEMLTDFFGGATAITPERIQAAIQERRELMREAAAEQRLEKWAASRRYDELDRQRGQHQPEIEDEQRRHYEGQYELDR